MLTRLAFPVAAAATAVLLVAPQASAATGYRGHWALNESGTPSRASDSSGHGNDGTNYNIQGTGAGYKFNGTSSRVVVGSASVLNPGSAAFSWGVTLSMTSPPSPVGETYDVLRKGLVTTTGGDYKLEVKNSGGKAVPRCVAQTVKGGGKVLASIQGGGNLADGRQHVVRCAKTSKSITVTVDSHSRTKVYSNGLGSVSNTSNLALGAKAESSASTGFDWFKGTLYDAWVR